MTDGLRHPNDEADDVTDRITRRLMAEIVTPILEQLAELEAIVRDLAASEPYLITDEGQPFSCAVCARTFITDPSPKQHAETCAVRRAVEYVADHPARDSE